MLGAVTVAVWPASAARRTPPRPVILGVYWSSAVTAVFVALLGWLFIETRDGSVLGLAERLTSSIQTCWPFIIAVALRRTRCPRLGLPTGGAEDGPPLGHGPAAAGRTDDGSPPGGIAGGRPAGDRQGPRAPAGLGWPGLPAAAELATIGAGYVGYALVRLAIHANRHAAFAHAAQLWSGTCT